MFNSPSHSHSPETAVLSPNSVGNFLPDIHQFALALSVSDNLNLPCKYGAQCLRLHIFSNSTAISDNSDDMERFSICSSGPTGIKSTWRDKRNPVDAMIQTEHLGYVEVGSQAKVSRGVEAQTDPCPVSKFEEMKEPYPPSLYAFFAKVTEPMCEALEENLNPIFGLSAIMSAIMAEDNEQADEEKDTAEELYELRSHTAPEHHRASCVAWNCQGAQVAIGYSEPSHSGWCVHQAPLSVWSVGRLQNLDPATVKASPPPPHKELILPACASAMEFHPSNPSVLAVGLHSGEVMLIDLHASVSTGSGSTGPDSKTRATSGILRRRSDSKFDQDEGIVNADGIFHVVNRSLHSVEVVSVKWITLAASTQSAASLTRKNPGAAQHMILTAGKDGLIGLWSVNKTYNRLYLEKRFIILPRNLPDDIDHKTRLIVSMKEIGITALASSPLDPASFTVGTFGCYLFQCDVTSQDELDPVIELDVLLSSKMTAELMNGNPQYLRQAKGYLIGLDYSPFHQNLLLGCTMHGHVEVVNTLKPGKPVLQLGMPKDEGVDAKWGGRPMVLGVAWDQTVSVYDLMRDDSEPAVNVEHKNPISAFAFNMKETDLLATVDTEGKLHIWRLPPGLKGTTETKQAEMDALIRLGVGTAGEFVES